MPSPPAGRDEKLLPLVGWITFIIGMGLIGVVIAYVDRGKARSPVRENYAYMVRTFWIGLAYACVPLVAYFAILLHGIGIVLSSPDAGFDTIKTGPAAGFPRWMFGLFAIQGVFLVLYLWVLARAIRGLVSLTRDIPIEKPKTWFV